MLEAGMGDTLATWTAIQGRLAGITTVLSYTRAGLGQSDPAPLPRTLRDMVVDLGKLLSVVALPGPYMFVGHSFGGQIVRLFAAQHQSETKAMALVDPSHEDKYARFEAVFTAQLIERQNAFLSDPSRNSEHVDLLESRRQLNAAEQVLNIPLVVLSRGRPDEQSPVWPTQAVQELELQSQRDLLGVSGYAWNKHIVAEHSGHYIHQEEPDLVLTAVEEVMQIAGISG
ncbi:MAG TPA: alpha/beta hydrolase [Chloroflexia bacterium]|nr:alpha/beta hydrolase [Chloroflexia bacterium]